jgi:hypothetical protein
VDEACGTHGRGEKIIQDSVGKPEGKRPLGRPWCVWGDSNKIDLAETGWEMNLLVLAPWS